MSVLLLTRATFYIVLFVCSVSWSFLLGLSVPVQVIDWKDLYCLLGCNRYWSAPSDHINPVFCVEIHH